MTLSLTTKLVGIYGGGSFGYGFADASGGQGLGPFYVAHVAMNAGGTIINPATEDTQSQILSSIRALAGRVETIWTDDTGAFFIRLDVAGALTWTDVSGAVISAPGAGARPANGQSIGIDRSSYTATAAGTGFAVGDYLDHVVTTDPTTGVVLGHFWLNVTQEAKLASAPASASISPMLPLPQGAATSAGQASSLLAAQAVQAATGAPTDIAASAPTGSWTLVALLKGILGTVQAPVLPNGAATETTLGAIKTAVQGTLATSVTSLPLPAGAATETSLLAVKAAVQNPPLPTGAATETSLAAVKTALQNTLAISATALPLPGGAATEATLGLIKTVLQTTLPVAATEATLGAIKTLLQASLPLPTGAATETTLGAIKTAVQGTLAISAANLPLPAGAAADGTDISGSVMPSGGAGIRGWLSALFTTLGARADAAATTGSVSLIALVKGLISAVGGGAPVSRSIASTVAATSTLLMAANGARKAYTIQAPQTAGLWLNPLGGAAGPNAVDCIYVPPGAIARESGAGCETTAITYYCGTAGLVISAQER